jgi:hypothetical protein
MPGGPSGGVQNLPDLGVRALFKNGTKWYKKRRIKKPCCLSINSLRKPAANGCTVLFAVFQMQPVK